MLTLISLPAGFDEPSLSPFCVKSMIQLEMSGLEWVPEYVADPGAGPLGRLPALRTDDSVIPESAFIQRYLEEQGTDFYKGLSTGKRAYAHAIIRMMEEHLRFGLLHDRWLDDRCWPAMKDIAFQSIPAPMRGFVATVARRQMRTGLKGQGIGRMTEAQRMQLFAPDLECLTDHLWETPYLFGNEPTAPDTFAVPLLSMLSGLPADTALRRAVRENPTLMAYIERGRTALYPNVTRFAVAA